MHSSYLKALFVGSISACFCAANAQSFVNGNFETGNLSGWTVTPTSNGTTDVQDAVQYDIDAGGPLTTNFAGHFAVAEVNFDSTQQGILLTQYMTLSSGIQYTFDFDWAAQTTGSNAEGGVFSLVVNGSAIVTQSAGNIGATPIVGHITALFTPTSTGSYVVGSSITRPWQSPGNLFQYVDNFNVSSPVPEPASLLVIALGAAGFAVRRRTRK